MLAAGAEGSHSPRPRLLTRGGKESLLSAFHYVLEPDYDVQDWFTHPGEEFVYVIRGLLAIDFADGETVEVGVGDSIHHPGRQPHRWRRLGTGTTEVLIVDAIPDHD